MKKKSRCASARQKLARGCGAKRIKGAWHSRPVYGRSHTDSIQTRSVFRAKPVWNRVGSALSTAPATQEHRTSRSAAGRVKGHTQPSPANGRLQPNSAAVSAVADQAEGHSLHTARMLTFLKSK